ncbi:hypothetical protein [Acinetobacter vivianii]|uniref:hypothetical protein n=1 Tax=Acinetobacter vivianii TaxID=1776742 RepID=UPI001906E83C|nr:hypothetical protein [Acinetobacter vivianii]MBJ8484815.1 hypothetical protein [Acinetobacter vivianii]
MTNLQMFELIASTKALQFKKLGVVSFTDDEKECLKEDESHQHIVILEFNNTLVKLDVPRIRANIARRMLSAELEKIYN